MVYETVLHLEGFVVLGCVRIFLNILSEAYAFRQSFSRFGRFLSAVVDCQLNGVAFSLVADEATVRSLLPVLLGGFFLGLDPSCWGGAILSASWWHDSSTSRMSLHVLPQLSGTFRVP